MPRDSSAQPTLLSDAISFVRISKSAFVRRAALSASIAGMFTKNFIATTSTAKITLPAMNAIAAPDARFAFSEFIGHLRWQAACREILPVQDRCPSLRAHAGRVADTADGWRIFSGTPTPEIRP